MEIAKVEVFKDGERVAWCDKHVKQVEVVIEGLPPMRAFSLPLVNLDRKKIFEHLNGKPLTSILGNSGIRVTHGEEAESLEPAFYIHGRSETMRGNTTVSSVVLAKFDCADDQLPEHRELIPRLPKIYRKVSALI